MQIFGLDFTSVPRGRKPITVVETNLVNQLLQVDPELICLPSLAAFEVFLNQTGPWLAGLDFPFGQPQKLIKNLGWPETWSGYVGLIANMSLNEFEATLTTYRRSRPTGDKHHLRLTDLKARARSPMMLVGVPVGKMFFQGAPRLLQSNVSVLPCRPTNDNRIVLETYPALVARRWIGSASYKNDAKNKQTAAQAAARQNIIEGILSPSFATEFGFGLELETVLADRLSQDPTGDQLDALLCALQAAWAYLQSDRRYGIPLDCDPAEGWIIDPDLRLE